jgi:hypothetical protein
VRDLLGRRDLGSFSGSFTGEVMPRDVVAVRISPAAEGGAGGGQQRLGAAGDDGWRPWRKNAYIERHGRRPGAAQRLAARQASRAARMRWASETRRPQSGAQ